MLLMSPSLLLQQCPKYLVRLTCEMRGMWPDSCYFEGCCFQDLFKTAYNILVLLLSSFFPLCILLHPYNTMDTTITWKKSCFILSDSSNFQMIDNLSIIFHTFTRCMLTSLSVEEILLLRYSMLLMIVYLLLNF